MELVEDDAPPSAGPGAPRPSPAQRAVRRVPRRVRVALAVAVVGALAGTGMSQAAADAALESRLARVDGLTASLAAPPREAWRVRGAGVLAVVDDVVVLWGPDGPRAVGTDVADGSARYVVPGFCQLVPTGPAAGRTAADDDPRPGPVARGRSGDLLFCVEDVPVPSATGRFAASTSTGRVLDPVTGAVRHEIALGTSGSWHVVDGDVVSIAVDPGLHVTAGRWSLDTGRQKWAYRGAAPPAAASGRWETSLRDTTARVRAGLWSVTIDVATGTPDPATITQPRAVDAFTADLPGGGSVSVRSSSATGVTTTVQPPDGGEPFTVPGRVAVPTVDDASAPGTVLVRQAGTRGHQRLTLVDVATGGTRWASTAPAGEVAVLSGTVLIRDAGGTTALDARTGKTRWSAPTGDSTAPVEGVVTDGRRLLALERANGAPELVARDVATGAPVWTSPAPMADAALVPLRDGTILAFGHGEVVALRP